MKSRIIAILIAASALFGIASSTLFIYQWTQEYTGAVITYSLGNGKEQAISGNKQDYLSAFAIPGTVLSLCLFAAASTISNRTTDKERKTAIISTKAMTLACIAALTGILAAAFQIADLSTFMFFGTHVYEPICAAGAALQIVLWSIVLLNIISTQHTHRKK